MNKDKTLKEMHVEIGKLKNKIKRYNHIANNGRFHEERVSSFLKAKKLEKILLQKKKELAKIKKKNKNISLHK